MVAQEKHIEELEVLQVRQGYTQILQSPLKATLGAVQASVQVLLLEIKKKLEMQEVQDVKDPEHVRQGDVHYWQVLLTTIVLLMQESTH